MRFHRDYTPERPNTGGPQLKFKFVETASFIVTAHQDKRSVALGLINEAGQRVPPPRLLFSRREAGGRTGVQIALIFPVYEAP